MARGDSVIRVSIIGDAQKLNKTLTQVDTRLGGLQKGLALAGGAFLASRVLSEVGDAMSFATDEADRLGDAQERLNRQLGPEFTANLERTAGAFTKIGLSTQDMLELEAVFADFATTAGVAEPIIASMAEKAAASAQAFALVDDQGRDASSVLDLITKAAGGSEKAARELGVSLIETDDAAAQLNNVLGQMQGRLNDTITGTADLEQKQSQLQARAEDLAGKLGGPLSDGLSSVLGFILDEIDAIPHAIEGWQMLGKAIENFGRTALAPLGNVADVLRGIVGLLSDVNRNFSGNFTGGIPEEQWVVNQLRRQRERNGLK